MLSVAKMFGLSIVVALSTGFCVVGLKELDRDGLFFVAFAFPFLVVSATYLAKTIVKTFQE